MKRLFILTLAIFLYLWQPLPALAWNGAVLPSDYASQAKLVAQKQAVLAGYRLADLLEKIYSTNIISQPT